MLTKRIIPCLDIKNGRTVKGVNFVDLIDAGNPVELAKKYSETGADELVFLDISATEERRSTLINLVREVAETINIPFTVGGGINSVEDVEMLLKNGADKVSINSSAVKNPDLINQLAQKFGSQCVVVAIDAKRINGIWKVHLIGGKQATDINLFDWVVEVEKRGDVEILLKNGADKVSINSSAVKNPDLINQLAQKFGSQCVVVAIDAKRINGIWKVHLVGGKQATEINLFDWVVEVEKRGAGEILFTSMENDGTKDGFANEALNTISHLVNIPIIASGGAGNKQDFAEAFLVGNADAALAASVFHFGEIEIPELKHFLKQQNISIRI